jgi:hypothetical protein
MRQKIHTCLLNSAKLAIVSPITEGFFAETLIVISGEVPIVPNCVASSCLVGKKFSHFECRQSR